MEFDWNDSWEISEESSFETLPEGTYNFEVVKFERTYTKEKGYKMAEITLKLTAEDGRQNLIRDWFVFIDSMRWKFENFFRALDVLEVGERLVIDFDGALGKKGRCEITIEESEKDGKTYKNNSVKKYLKKSKSESPKVSSESKESLPW